jgi:hypothetical protein
MFFAPPGLPVPDTNPSPSIIVQKTTGWCSPVIANVVGNVTITCIGVSPMATRKLNLELSHKKLELADKIREANQWTAKYKELEERLASAADDSVLSRQAEKYLHEGDFDRAGALLDQIIRSEETKIDQLAENLFNRGIIFELQYKPEAALPQTSEHPGQCAELIIRTARKSGLRIQLRPLIETEPCKPTPSQMHAQFFDKLALAADAIQIADQHNTQQQLRIDRWTAGIAVARVAISDSDRKDATCRPNSRR